MGYMPNQVLLRAGICVGACASLLWPGSGIAAADPDVVGKQYWEAKNLLSQANLTPVVATVVGDRVPQDQCYVASISKVSSRDASGNATTNQVQVNLNCYARPAGATAPGLSAGDSSQPSQKIRDGYDEADKNWKQSPEGQQWCAETATEHPDWGPLKYCDLSAGQ
jgi:hypothetical protein